MPPPEAYSNEVVWVWLYVYRSVRESVLQPIYILNAWTYFNETISNYHFPHFQVHVFKAQGQTATAIEVS